MIAMWLTRFAPAIMIAAAAVAALMLAYYRGAENARLRAELETLRSTIEAEEIRREADDRAASDPDPVGRLQREYGSSR